VTRRLRVGIAAVACAAVAAALAAVPAGAVNVVPDGGVVVLGSTADVKREIDVAHDAGARWVSLSASWESLEPQPDSYRVPGGAGSDAWAALSERLAYARSRDMNVELRMSDAPPWASGRQGSDDPPTAAHLNDYGAFLTDLGARLGPMIDAYSPWNEPNRPAFWSPTDPDAFTALQKAAYPAIKASDPTATVIYGPVVGRYASQNSGYGFLRRSYQLGAKGSFDVIGWNGYPGGPPESPGPIESGVPAGNTLPAQLYLRSLIDQVDPGRKVWLMEFGWSTCVRCDVSVANGASEATQADYLTRAFDYRRRFLSTYVERIFWFNVRDLGTDRNAWELNHGLIRNDFSAKPALAAFSALGVEDRDGELPATGGGSRTATLPSTTLPSSSRRAGLPTRASSTRGRVALGKARLTWRRGVFTLRLPISLRGGAAKLRIDGYRTRRWRHVTSVKIRRSGRLTVRIRDRGFVGFRIRSTVPGRRGFRVARIVKVPPKIVRARWDRHAR
jgi:hypothetical protein